MKIIRTIVVAALSIFSMVAQGTVITFVDEIVEAKPNGYTVSGVTFSDSVEADLFVVEINGNNGLAVLYDDESFLNMSFQTISNSLSLMFGNDIERATVVGDRALLTLFLHATEVGHASVDLNRNGDLDQTISLAGINFDQASFGYVHSNGVALDLIELVDNITFTAADSLPPPASVPEPASFALLGLGLFGIRLSRSKRVPGVGA